MLAAVKSIKPTWWLTLILIVGAYLRFAELQYVRHGYDEGYQAYDAVRLLDAGQWPRIGQPSSVFLDNPPLMPYLQALPLFFWRSLWSVYIFITILNTLAIWFVYQATRQLLDQTAAFLATILFTISPWVIHFSRAPWTQGLLPFFTAVIAWGLWPNLVSAKPERPWPVLIGFIAAIAMMQTYVVAFGILLPLTILLLMYWRCLPQRPFRLALLLFFLSLLLYGAGLTTGTERNSGKFLDFLTQHEISFTPQAWQHATRYVTGLNYDGQEPIPPTTFPWHTTLTLTHYLLLAALLFGIIQAFRASCQPGSSRRLALILLIWFVAPIVGLSFLPTMVHPHYLLLTLPAGQLLAAWGLLPLCSQPRLRWGIATLLLLIALVFRLRLYQVGQTLAATPFGYGFNGWSLTHAAQLGQTVRTLSGQDPHTPRRIYAEDQEALLSGMSATYLDTLTELEYDRFTLLPSQAPMLYVLLNQPTASLLWGPKQTPFPPQIIGNNTIAFVQVGPYNREEALLLPQTAVNWTSDAGLTFLGYTFTTPPPYSAGQSFDLITYWRVEELHPDRDQWFIQPFIQILNSQWQLIANKDGHGQWGHRWQPGDIYVQRTSLTVPSDSTSGDYQLLIGLYDPIHEARQFNLNGPTGPTFAYSYPLPIN